MGKTGAKLKDAPPFDAEAILADAKAAPPMVITYARYMAETDALYGDEDFGKSLREEFLTYGVPKPTKMDGLSRIHYADGTILRRLIIKDFFSASLPGQGPKFSIRDTAETK